MMPGCRTQGCGNDALAGRRVCAECRRAQQRKAMRRLRDTPQRFKERLRDYGLSDGEAGRLASLFADPSATCACCGVPQWFIWRLAAEGRWPPGGARHWLRLTIDHEDVEAARDVVDNLRLLCYSCQNKRGRGRYTDAEVRRHTRRMWRRRYADHDLAWMRVEKGEQL